MDLMLQQARVVRQLVDKVASKFNLTSSCGCSSRHVLQEMKEEAKSINKANKLTAPGCLVRPPSTASDLVSARQEEPQVDGRRAFDLAGLSDKNFAIAESALEEARKNYSGNWLVDKSAKFTQEFGSIVKDCGGLDDDDVDESSCQALLGPGLCCSQLESDAVVVRQYKSLRSQCVALLRMLRSERRAEGYARRHGLLLVMGKTSKDPGDAREVHLLGKVSFSPFHFTSVRYSLQDSAGTHAQADLSMVGQDAIFEPMPKLLYRLARAWRPGWELGTARYTAISLKSITIETGAVQALSGISVGVHGVAGIVGGDTDEEDTLIAQRQSLLRGACHKNEPPAAKKRAPKRNAPINRKRPAPTAPDRQTDAVDNAIEVAWQAALEDQEGFIPQQPSSASASASSSSRAPAASDRSARTADPQPMTGVPWKEAESGQCFILAPSADISRPLRKIHLGSLDLKCCLSCLSIVDGNCNSTVTVTATAATALLILTHMPDNQTDIGGSIGISIVPQ